MIPSIDALVNSHALGQNLHRRYIQSLQSPICIACVSIDQIFPVQEAATSTAGV